MNKEAQALRQQMDALREEQARADPTRPPTFPQELIERVARYVRQQARGGKTLLQCSQELGVPRARLHYWVYQRTKLPEAGPERSLLRPVQVSSQIVHVQDGVPERRYRLRSPAGWVLEDLRLPELMELLRSLP